MKIAITIATQRSTVINSLMVSLVVGIILNLINQWDAVTSLKLDQLDPFKVILTFIVPYLVSTYSATKAKLTFNIGQKSAIDTHVECHSCHSETNFLKKNETIEICPRCIENTNWKIIDHEQH